MVGLAGARVLVVDDESEAAVLILKALSKLSIPSAWFTGEADQLPDQQFSGVRLAVLDMDLLPSSTDEREKLDFLELVLGRLLGCDNGPYGILAWTANPALLEQFQARLFASDQIPSPMFVLALEKPCIGVTATTIERTLENKPASDIAGPKHSSSDVPAAAEMSGPETAPSTVASKEESLTEQQRSEQDIERFTFDAATEQIRKRLHELKTMNILQTWEGGAVTSAAQVVNALFALADGQVRSKLRVPEGSAAEHFTDAANRTKWTQQLESELLAILRALCEAEIGIDLQDEPRALRALFSAMNPLHADQLERGSDSLIAQMKDHSNIVSSKAEPLSTEQAAKINSAIQLCPEVSPGPGAIYDLTGLGSLSQLLPSLEDLLLDLSMVPRKQEGEEDNVYKEKLAGHLRAVGADVRAVFVEVNPICDYSQQNIRQRKLLGALIVPENKLKAFKKSRQEALGAIYHFGPIYLDDKQVVVTPGTHYLIASSLHVPTLPASLSGGLKPFMRMRLQALVRLMAWLGYQSSRPGMLFITRS